MPWQLSLGVYGDQGFTESGGLELDAAAELYRKSGAAPEAQQATFDLADLDGDGVLDLRQFCLFMVLVKGLRGEDAPALPHALSPTQVRLAGCNHVHEILAAEAWANLPGHSSHQGVGGMCAVTWTQVI